MRRGVGFAAGQRCRIGAWDRWGRAAECSTVCCDMHVTHACHKHDPGTAAVQRPGHHRSVSDILFLSAADKVSGIDGTATCINQRGARHSSASSRHRAL